MLSVEQVRKDIPLLAQIVYLESASVSPPPRPVIDAMTEYYTNSPFNYGVGVFQPSIQLVQKVDSARKKIATFLHAEPDEIVFTKNTTEAINLLASGLDWKKDDEVIISSVEHQSNYIPWLRLGQECGVKVRVVKTDSAGILDVAAVEENFTDKTRLVSVTHVSNVFGTIQRVSEVCKLAREHNALSLVDAAQSVGRLKFDVKEIGCDFTSICGRKSLGGPQGTGALFGRHEALEQLRPLEVGSRASDLVSQNEFKIKPRPHRFEAGIINTSGFIGLGRAVEYAQDIGIDDIRARIQKLTKYAKDQLRKIENVELYGPDDLKLQAGILSINVKGKDPNQVAKQLYQEGKIAVGSGNQGSLMAMKQIGVEGIVRISFHYYNTENEIDTLATCLRRI